MPYIKLTKAGHGAIVFSEKPEHYSKKWKKQPVFLLLPSLPAFFPPSLPSSLSGFIRSDLKWWLCCYELECRTFGSAALGQPKSMWYNRLLP